VKFIKKCKKYIIRRCKENITRFRSLTYSISPIRNIDNNKLNYEELTEKRKKPTKKLIDLSSIQRVNFEAKEGKYFFVGDNTDTANFGCRGTSQALLEVLTSKGFVITDRIKRNELLNLFHLSYPWCGGIEEIYKYISAVKYYDSITYNTILNRIQNSDILILNGEGSFIFQSPPRKDMLNMLVLLYACIETRIPFFVLNAMFSFYAQGSSYEQPRNEKLFKQCISILDHSAIICARDMVSFDLIRKNCDNVNIHYCPDALFSWYDYYTIESEKLDMLLRNYQNCSVFNGISENNISFNKKYILMAGNSYVSSHTEEAEEYFLLLASQLKELARKKDFQLYFIECCGGDRILRKISKKLGIYLIPVETNIRLAGYILGKAECFISGRYHPSILASLGGTPCVFMGSNSHKTLSLQEVLGVPKDEQVVYNAIPDSNDIELIIKDTERKLRKSRDELKKTCEVNCQVVKNFPLYVRGNK